MHGVVAGRERIKRILGLSDCGRRRGRDLRRTRDSKRVYDCHR
jgi:hypothetical protein